MPKQWRVGEYWLFSFYIVKILTWRIQYFKGFVALIEVLEMGFLIEDIYASNRKYSIVLSVEPVLEIGFFPDCLIIMELQK